MAEIVTFESGGEWHFQVVDQVKHTAEDGTEYEQQDVVSRGEGFATEGEAGAAGAATIKPSKKG